MSRILLTGVSGQLGHVLQTALAPLGEVHAVSRAEMDLADASSIQARLDQWQPAIIINPAAYTAVDRAESEEAQAMAVNAHAPAAMAQWAARHDALLMHYSTDYVFDGQLDRPYREEDATAPQSAYGRSKCRGEEAIRASGCRHLILRTSWVFGAHGGNFLKTMLRLGAEREQLRIVADQFGAPTSTALIAEVSAAMLQQAIAAADSLPLGTYHLTAQGRTSWCDYARFIFAEARLRGAPLMVREVEGIPASAYPLPATRPANSSLDCHKLMQDYRLTLPDWQAGVRQVLDQLLPSRR
ncbi:dTDP-4-dehydrorhamnose reductase [Paludibacterium sp. THUN1379]|uniref:dTDP-4-dehydrorhamnose reductase n=1 Tax=Paludibacterium sp. THUN1379 TaxID=3112107 RepID=UPI00308BE1BC|nr:dTDP-4-dehydrorhamnose reductase [Paludibacterium sp. THUN1379]